ncbi:hypothetical protein C7S18_22970 [Ahniella affigens]|uniref:Nucleoside 2-deoxyribosyltransferase n=2 Tax=Ahniella affigens TaxID=2021234 RepID=A0A2P1PYE4_9GAMM|nr:hypothetical protein C7S18_22970 [Ahniella affigens]
MNTSIDWPLISDRGLQEAYALLNALEDQKRVKVLRPSSYWTISITSKGWEDLEDALLLSEERDLAFAAMHFSQSFIPVFECMSRAAEHAGYRCERVDTVAHADHIDQRLIDYLKRCRFVIADFTHNSHNVYFETGYALALGKPVIWTIREGEESHFDTRQYYFRKWHPDRLDEFAQELEESIGAIVGRLKPKGN